MNKVKIKGYDNSTLVGYYWEDVSNPKGVVQIIHGMQEHAKRYDDFAKFLNSNGYIVFASDLRGHGETVGDVNKQGYSDGDIFEQIINDQITISNMLKEKYNLPLYVIGHSFGSFVSQMYISRCNVADKVILSGSAYTKNIAFTFGNIVAHINSAFVGKDKTAKFLEKNSFGAYGKKFEDGNWLTRNKEIFDEYKKDPYCGHPFPYSFYKSMFSGALKNYKNLGNINKNMPILILSGDDDPVGNYGKLVVKLYNTYKKQGLNVQYKLYNGARHEILNETNKQEVYQDIIDFLAK